MAKIMGIITTAIILGCLLMLGGASGGALGGYSLPASTPSYQTIVVLPDTQNYSEFYPDIYKSQTQWIEDNRETENIVQVIHVGDVVNDADNITQWDNSKQAMDILTMPYIVALGNHDYSKATYFDNFNKYYGNVESYSLLDINNEEWIIATVNPIYCYVAESVNRTKDILSDYPDRNVILVAHGYINYKGQLSAGSQNGSYIYDNLVSENENIFMVLCGHFYKDDLGEYHTVDEFVSHTVHNLLSNYQGRENGGNGFLRLMRFYDDRIEVQTYSPYLDEYETDADSQFTIELPETTTPQPENTPARSNGGGGGGRIPGYTRFDCIDGHGYFYDDITVMDDDRVVSVSIRESTTAKNRAGSALHYIKLSFEDGIYNLEPHGAYFDQPVRMSFSYEVSGGYPALSIWNDTFKDWHYVDMEIIDDTHAQADINILGKYKIIEFPVLSPAKYYEWMY